jgi:hypothetical protein
METKFKLVETEEYTLAVSDEIQTEIHKLGNGKYYKGWYHNGDWKKIIAYQPKGNAPELDLPLLPEFEPRGFDEFEYTEDDLDKAIDWALEYGRKGKVTSKDIDEFIQSLKQPKWFVAEIFEDRLFDMHTPQYDRIVIRLKTTTINGKTYLVGTYLN